MKVMFQKVMVMAAAESVILISILFFFIFMGMQKTMETEQERTERYIVSTAGNAVHAIRNEILFLFENYSEKIRETDFSDWDGEIRSLGLKEVHQLDDFPSVVKNSFFLDQDMIRGKPSSDSQGRHMYFYREFLGHLNDIRGDRTLSIINIYDLEGYMAYPVKNKSTDDVIGYLVFFLDIRSVVEEYMPGRLMKEFKMSGLRNGRDTKQEYLVQLKRGKDIVLNKEQFLIDLNRDFNLFNIQDYYYSRPDAFVPIMKNSTITENHSYLAIYHREAEPGAFMRKKVRNYLMLAVLYLILVSVVLTFLYSVYRIKREFKREQGFTSLISHELKTPLSVIQMGSESLAGGYVTGKEEVAEYGALIRDEAGRLGRMIENILLVSTLSWAEEKSEALNVGDLLEEIRRDNLSLLRKRGIVWKEENLAGGVTLYSNGLLLKAALQNLVHNGIIYGAERSRDRTLLLRTEQRRKKGEGVLFSVIDHGPGIARAEAQKIFGNYFRGKEVRDSQQPGSGVGLALSLRIAEKLDGTLQLNRLAKGETAFELWLPLGKKNEKNPYD